MTVNAVTASCLLSSDKGAVLGSRTTLQAAYDAWRRTCSYNDNPPPHGNEDTNPAEAAN